MTTGSPFSIRLLLIWLAAALVTLYLTLPDHSWSQSNQNCIDWPSPGLLQITCSDAPRIDLSGEWQLSWRSTDNNSFQQLAAPVPGRWHNLAVNNQHLERQGRGVYLLDVVMPEPRNNLTLNPGVGLTDMIIRITDRQGEEVFSYSNKGSDGSPRFPQLALPLPQLPAQFSIQVDVANPAHAYGGMEHSPFIAPLEEIISQQFTSIAVTAFYCAGYLIAGLYSLAIWLGRKRDKAPLMLSTLCAIMITRLLFIEHLAVAIWPGLPLQFIWQVGWATLFGLGITMPVYLHQITQKPTLSWPVALLVGTAALGLILTVTSPSTLYIGYGEWWRLTSIPLLLWMTLLYFAAPRHGFNATPAIFGLLGVAMICSLSDLLAHVLVITPKAHLGNAGVFILITGQTLLIAGQYTSGLERQQHLSSELEELNKSLESKVIERTNELTAVNQRLQSLAMTDPLTQLGNRRAFDDNLAIELAQAKRDKLPLSLMLLDIDNFKRVNDKLGHEAGDQLLQAIAATLTEQVRPSDRPARLGGDEFAAILPDADTETAIIVATRLKAQIDKAALTEQHLALGASISIGIATWHGHQEQQLYTQADDALYEAKNGGKNCIACATEPL